MISYIRIKKVKIYFKKLLFAFLFLHAGFSVVAQQEINWEDFLSRNDMVFDTLTTRWEDGLFTGNGLIGAMLYMKDDNTLRLEIGRTDVTDHRTDSILHLYAKARLPIGHFEIRPSGQILKNTARLNLWDAEGTGEIVTDSGTIRWRTMTLSLSDIIIFQYHTTGNEKNITWKWIPEISISSRTKYANDIPVGYKANPDPFTGQSNDVNYCSQPMLAGGDYTTAWKETGDDKEKTFFVTVGYNRRESSLSEALRNIQNASATDLQSAIMQHRQWWHQYYPESFVSIPDARMDSFYWIQQYKLASATRQGKPPIDLMGPWFRYTPWPAYWFNLNIQLTYSPLFTANRLALSEGLIRMINNAQENLGKNVPEPYQHNAASVSRSGAIDMISTTEITATDNPNLASPKLEMGNLTWILYYYWLQYRYTMDDGLKTSLFPILKKSIQYYIDVMHKGDDGKWHLPYTYSPEYPGGITRDCNYDLSLFRWGCRTLLQINPYDESAGKWKDVLRNLTGYPIDSTGLRIGRDVAFSQSHRHFSHMLMIYPLHLMNWEQPENRNLIKKSLEHWHSFKGALQGYSFTGGASMYAMMGDGNKAEEYLNQLLNRYVKPNTMYLETGPVIETPLSAVTSIHELLLQSWGNKIRVFPAVPDHWQDVSFSDLRTEGAFLVSAVRKNGETKWVKIKSLAGESFTIHPNIKGVIQIKENSNKIKNLGSGNFQINLDKDEEIIMYHSEDDLSLPAGPVQTMAGDEHAWGTKKIRK